MRSVDYVPSICKGENPAWKGSIKLRPPTFDEKYEYLENLGLNIDEQGAVKSETLEKIKSIRKLVSLSQKHYLEVSLERVSDSAKFVSFDDMQYEDDLHGVLAEVASLLVQGFRVGNG